MRILLKQGIEKLGERGEIVEVADGYARNFLLPRNVAVPAMAGNFRQLEIERAKIAKQVAAERVALETAHDRLESTSCTIVAPASPEGHLYGSVGARDIAQALNKEGFEVNEHNIRLEQPFKEIGVHLVDIELASDLTGRARVWILAE